MGAQQTKADILNEVMNEAANSVINKISSTAESNIDQINELNLSGKIKNSSISQKNISDMNVSAMIKASADGKLNAELSNAIASAVQQKSNALGVANSEANIKSIIHNNIQNHITQESLSKALGISVQKNIINMKKGTEIEDSEISQENQAKAVTKLIQDANAEAILALKADNSTKASLEQTVTNPISDFLTSPSLVIIVVVVAGVYLFKDKIPFLGGGNSINCLRLAGLVIVVGLLTLMFLNN
jgi:hypothetical protein